METKKIPPLLGVSGVYYPTITKELQSSIASLDSLNNELETFNLDSEDDLVERIDEKIEEACKLLTRTVNELDDMRETLSDIELKANELRYKSHEYPEEIRDFIDLVYNAL